MQPLLISFIHEGHGEPGQGQTLVHYLTEPVHVAGIALVLAGLLAGWWLWTRRAAVTLNHHCGRKMP